MDFTTETPIKFITLQKHTLNFRVLALYCEITTSILNSSNYLQPQVPVLSAVHHVNQWRIQAHAHKNIKPEKWLLRYNDQKSNTMFTYLPKFHIKICKKNQTSHILFRWIWISVSKVPPDPEEVVCYYRVFSFYIHWLLL